MGKKHKPRCGSLAFYPRKRAKKQTRHFKSFKKDSGKTLPVNFLAYKAGMLQVSGIDRRKGAVTQNQEVVKAVTILEAPPLKVYGIRAYGKLNGKESVIGETLADNLNKHLLKRLNSENKGKTKKEKKRKSEGIGKDTVRVENEKKKEFDFNVMISEIHEIRLLVHTQPYLTGFGKKLPDVSEVSLSGNVSEQLKLAQERLGKEVSVRDFLAEKDFVDIKGVTKGKGIQGPVKKFGVKIQGRKAQTARVVGSIGPWHPATVMFTVGRPGQMGYHTRTEYNKRIILIGNAEMLKNYEFMDYGRVKNEFIALGGSVVGPEKRIIALRKSIRPLRKESPLLEEVRVLA